MTLCDRTTAVLLRTLFLPPSRIADMGHPSKTNFSKMDAGVLVVLTSKKSQEKILLFRSRGLSHAAVVIHTLTHSILYIFISPPLPLSLISTQNTYPLLTHYSFFSL